MLFRVPLRVPPLRHAQNNPRKSGGKELFSPFKNKTGIGKNLGPVDKVSISVNTKK